jgi:hypothetical protein
MPQLPHDESDMTATKLDERTLTTSSGRPITALMLCATFALIGSAFAADPSSSSSPDPSAATGDRPTPAQTELMQGVNDRRHEAATEKADNQHQAEMKKCEGLVWEEAKLCKDQVSTETAQTQAKSEKDREKKAPSP